MILPNGTVVNKIYRIVSFLGRGPSGNIYMLERIRDRRKIIAEELSALLSNKKCRIFFKEIIVAKNKKTDFFEN